MANVKSVFVSYSSQDCKFVDTIVNMMQKEGISYWKAPEMIPAGSSYAREIPRAIKECEVFLLVLSRTSQKSIWVEKETDSAISHRKTIIPFQIDDIPLNDTFRFYLNNVQMISYSANKEDAMNQLKQHLNQLIKGEMTKKKDLIKNQKILEVQDLSEKSDSVENVKTIVNNTKTDRKDTGNTVVSLELPQYPKRSYVKNDSNALRINRIPLECDYCGSKMIENVTMGTYRCQMCGKDSYDDFQTIRNYLEKVGNATVAVIHQNTGVPRRVIEHFFREEYLEIPKNSPVRVPCEQCGAPIRTGVLCESCKSGGNAKGSQRYKGAWHTLFYTED